MPMYCEDCKHWMPSTVHVGVGFCLITPVEEYPDDPLFHCDKKTPTNKTLTTSEESE